MPLYEYQCAGCHRQFTALVGVVANPRPVACPRCGSDAARRLMSRFARLRSEDEVMDSLADSADFSGIDENDPTSVARFMKQMGSEMGEDFGDDFEQALDEEMAGETDEGGAAGATDDL